MYLRVILLSFFALKAVFRQEVGYEVEKLDSRLTKDVMINPTGNAQSYKSVHLQLCKM
jgi:hypothetical protein